MIRLVLFDIDGTLLRGRDGANLEGWLAGLEHGMGLVGAHPDDIFHAGFTDLGTVLGLAAHYGLSEAEARSRAPAFFAIKDQIMAERAAADPRRARLEATVGAVEILATLLSRGRKLGLVTGNSPIAAMSKLARAGLDPQVFEVGGYGDACVTRQELVGEAVAAAARRWGRIFAPEEVATVGDTALDIEAARDCHVRAIGVLGGRGDRASLAMALPQAILDDLRPPRSTIAILGADD